VNKPNVGGRPLKFETPDDLSDVINDYLQNTDRIEWTVTGLCLAIGTSRQVLDDYQKRDEYTKIVNMAKLYVENAYELSLRENGGAGNIFALKNFGWKDQQIIDSTITKVKDIVIEDA